MCFPAHLSRHHMPLGTHRGQKRVPAAMGVLGIQSRSSGRAVCTLNFLAISPDRLL